MDDRKKQKNKQDDEQKIEEEVEEEDSEIKKLEERNEDLQNQLKRAVADYINLENRNREERLEFVKFANKNLLESLLPAFDTLLLAEKYTEDENFRITVKHILEVLKNAGIEKVETTGKAYDPITMEAVEVLDGPENEVIEETQPGFLLNGRVIRPARVKVGGNKEQ